MPRPMPVPPPVTSATCPLSLTRRSSSESSPAGLHDQGRSPARSGGDHESHGALVTRDAARSEPPGDRREIRRLQPERREGRLRESGPQRRELEEEAAKAQLEERPVG